MTHRTTFALDGATATRLRRLSSIWHVSQAEVVRRAVAQADALSVAEKPDPVLLLRALHAAGKGLDQQTAQAYMDDVREDRSTWRSK